MSLRARFRRRYVVLPLIAALALLIGAYVWIEVRRTMGVALTERMRAREDRIRILAELSDSSSDAESSQRAYLLSGERRYLEPFDAAERATRTLLDSLRQFYSTADTVELPTLRRVTELLEQRFARMRATLAMPSLDQARQTELVQLRSDQEAAELVVMNQLLDDLRAREQERAAAETVQFQQMVAQNRLINTADMLVTLCMMIVTAILVIREIERRNAVAQELDAKVAERTAELTALGDHSRRVIEEDRRRLARELHDEMGGILIAIKMDLAQLARKIDLTEPLVARRWAAIHSSLNSGIELKRRVIEELRPTLLDNMGLAAALRWQAEESSQRAGLKLRMDIPEEEPPLSPDVSIELFRVLQETLTNVVKHARASTVEVRLEVRPDCLLLTVEDDGIGLPAGQSIRTGAHGLTGMRYRAQSLGGTLDISPVTPHGTRVRVRVPLTGRVAAGGVG